MCFIGLLLRLTLHTVMLKLAILYGGLLLLEIIHRSQTISPEELHEEPETQRARLRHITPTLITLALAILFSVVTLTTPRDYDDWFYLAYISDYVAGQPLASEDAIFDQAKPAPARAVLGGTWWVIEAVFSKASGLHPVDCHQIYLSLLLVPFGTFAIYTLAKSLFQSVSTAVAACALQMLFYLSSVFPYKSTGWFVFCRIAQDKAVACFTIVPIVAASGIRLLQGKNYSKRLLLFYLGILGVSILVHPMGPAWSGLLIAPLIIIEWLRHRDRAHTLKYLLMLLPFVGYIVALIMGRQAVSSSITVPPHDVTPIPPILSNIYLPGNPFGKPIETFHPIVTVFAQGFRILSPLFITRYPLAFAGLALTVVTLRDFKSQIAARFLVGTTVAVLLILFTPPGVWFGSWLLNPRLIFRLVWVLPWGFVITFALARLRLRPPVLALAIIAIGLALARGNPQNYITSPKAMYDRNRPSKDARRVLMRLASEPVPQGLVFASEATGRMIPAFVPQAYPVNFREYGPVSQDDLSRLTKLRSVEPEFLDLIDDLDIGYVMLEADLPLAHAIRRSPRAFIPLFRNASYMLWGINRPSGQLTR